MIPVCDLATKTGRDELERVIARLRQTASLGSDAGRATMAVVEAVRERGDDAVVQYMRKWTDPGFDAGRVRVAPSELDAGLDAMPADLRAALEQAIENVTAYQRHVMPAAADPVRIGDAELGLRWTAVDSAGLCVPGGNAVLFSTLVMLAVPAMVAGVPADRISVISPPPTRRDDGPGGGDISPIVLGTCGLLGIERVYRIGGAQGVAALAFGTDRVEPVDLIAGPGNVFVQLAKQLVSGTCGTDNGFYGPSEVVTLADAAADPRRVAADLLAQAEHDPGKCFFLTWDRGVLDAALAQLEAMVPQRKRKDAIVAALRDESAAVLCGGEAEALALADRFAAEHVNLATADPRKTLSALRHGGEYFLGDAAPVAAGDYYAGPSHCLPTGTTARFASGVSVYTFLKRSGTVAYPDGMSEQTIRHIATLADAEALDAHAASARVRGS